MSEPLLIRTRPPRPVAIAMLQAAQLPTEDLAKQTFEDFLYTGPDGAPKGLVGLEIYDGEALLRSLVVDGRERGRGLGQALVAQAETHARNRGVTAIYLLTTTAEPFFKKLGYERLDRSAAPTAIQGTREYAALCPRSSAFMRKELDTPTTGHP